MNVKVHQRGLEGLHMLHRAAIESWTSDKWGQPSVQIAEWLIEGDIVQAFIRLQRGALIIEGRNKVFHSEAKVLGDRHDGLLSGIVLASLDIAVPASQVTVLTQDLTGDVG